MIDHYESGTAWILTMTCDYCHISGTWPGTRETSQMRAYVDGWRLTPSGYHLCRVCSQEWQKRERSIKRKRKAEELYG